jgi:hypothetical protein
MGMRRLVLGTIALSIGLAVSSPSVALNVNAGVYRRVFGSFSTPAYSVIFGGYVGDGATVTGYPPALPPGAPYSSGYVRVTRKSDGGQHLLSGSLSVNVDPMLTSGSVSGTLTGSSGSITIFAAVTSTAADFFFPQNFQYAQVPMPVPGGSSDWVVDTETWLGRTGTSTGGFSSSVLGGALDATGYAYMDRGVWAYADGSLVV